MKLEDSAKSPVFLRGPGASNPPRYFIDLAAPSLFFPLGIVLLRSRVLPRPFGYLALVLAGVFAALGAGSMLQLTLPSFVLGFAGVQALWWLAAAITLMVRGGQMWPSQG